MADRLPEFFVQAGGRPPVPSDQAGSSTTQPVFGVPTHQDNLQRIQDCLVPLASTGIRRELFTPESINGEGFTVDGFVKLARVITSFTDQKVLDEIIAIGVRNRHFTNDRTMTVSQFVTFCKFLKTAEGQREIQQVQRTEKLQKKAGPNQTVDSFVLGQVFRIQCQEWSSAVKATREEFDQRILVLRRQIQTLEREKEDAIAAIGQEFIPASSFPEPSIDVMNREAYEYYAQEARRHNRPMMPRNDVGLSHARSLYDNLVRGRKIMQYLQDEDHRYDLCNYLYRRILKFDEDGDVRQAQTFRNYMAAIGGFMPPESTEGTPTAAEPVDTRRETTPPGGDLPGQPIDPVVTPQATAGEASIGRDDQVRSVEFLRERYSTRSKRAAEPSRPPAARGRGRKRAAHPRR